MRPETPRSAWGNELEFLSWDEFKHMAPSILQLEITRLGQLIKTFQEDTDWHNSLVRARYAVQKFVACVEHADKDTLEDTCAGHLRSAIVSLSFEPDGMDEQTKKTRSYIIDRLRYVDYRIRLIY